MFCVEFDEVCIFKCIFIEKYVVIGNNINWEFKYLCEFVYKCCFIKCFEFVKIRVIYDMSDNVFYVIGLLIVCGNDVVNFFCVVMWWFYVGYVYIIGFFFI